jgi:type I restriction enzyme S subunit
MTNEIVNVPELRFPEFNEEWDINIFGDVVTNKSSKYTPKKTEALIDIELDSIESNTGRLIKNYTSNDFSSQKNVFKQHQVLYSKLRPYLNKYYFPNFDGVCTSEIWILDSKYSSTLSNEFLYYFIQTNKFKEVTNKSSGSKMPRADWNLVGNMRFNITSLKEQQKIGQFFSKLDRQIELEEQKLEKLEEQKKGYMQKIFSQEVRFKDDNGNSYPEWESAPLFDIFSATKGKSLSKDKISDDGKYECILYGEIYTTYAEKIESIVSRTNYYEGILSKKNDLIFPNSTTTNAWDLATFSSLQKNNVLIGGDISILRTKRSDISSLFYAYYLTNYLKLRKDIAKYAQGITIVHLSFNNFCKIKVQIPSLEEQNNITDFIDSLNQQQKLITNKIKLLKERKKGFLQKMFV